jgi:hypothetical protein
LIYQKSWVCSSVAEPLACHALIRPYVPSSALKNKTKTNLPGSCSEGIERWTKYYFERITIEVYVFGFFKSVCLESVRPWIQSPAAHTHTPTHPHKEYNVCNKH